MSEKKLYRRDQRSDIIIGGVCGGIADYLDIPDWVTRIAAVLAAFTSGFGILLYIALYFIMKPKKEVLG